MDNADFPGLVFVNKRLATKYTKIYDPKISMHTVWDLHKIK